MMNRASGLTLGQLLVLGAVLLILVALIIPGLFSSTGCSNDRRAAMELKTLSSAEVDFRTNDRDRNKVLDFWTADVKSLYTLTPATPGPPPWDDPLKPIALINLSTAAADGDDTFYPAGGENLLLSQFCRSETSSGYWFMALTTNKSASNPSDRSYRTDTGGTPPMGAVHHKTRYGFVAVPHGWEAGRLILRVNEDGTVFSEDLRKDALPIGFEKPPGLKHTPPHYLEWPNDDDLRRHHNPLK